MGIPTCTGLRLFALLLLGSGALVATAAKKPHVIFILTDDNGWAGVGYNNPHLHTPTLDALAADGLKLTSHYVYQFCAPTRGSFLTGRMPYRLASTKKNFIPWHMPDGTHLGYSMLPQKLKAANYTSVHIGKWHQGLYAPQFTPVGRGFDHSYGFLEGGEDHNTSRTFGNWCKKGEVDLSAGDAGDATPAGTGKWDACEWTELPGVALHNYYDNRSVDIANNNPYPAAVGDEAGCKALCEARIDCAGYSWRTQDPTHPYFHHCFLVAADGGAHKGSAGFASALCARGASGAVPTTGALRGRNGTYTGELFAAEAVRVIRGHDPAASPLFMYLALHDTHAPLEAPWRYAAQYARLHDPPRAQFSGMVSFVDEAVANVTAAIKANGNMWEDTLLVWTNDNGSPVQVGGSNHPLRGGKGSNWEGGTRVPAFVNGGLLPAAMRGRTHGGLIAISDWHATVLRLAGLDPAAGEPAAVAPLDGVDAWPWLSGARPASARSELVYQHLQHNVTAAGGCAAAKGGWGVRDASGLCSKGALRVDDGAGGRWKLVVGPEAQNGWYGWYSPNASVPFNQTAFAVQRCHPTPCLMDLNASATEHEDVAARHPDVAARLLRRFVAIGAGYHPPLANPKLDLSGYCAAVARNGNFVGPWLRAPNGQTGGHAGWNASAPARAEVGPELALTPRQLMVQ
eukprot:g4643.t1